MTRPKSKENNKTPQKEGIESHKSKLSFKHHQLIDFLIEVSIYLASKEAQKPKQKRAVII